jgi:hypothetical protein
VWALAGVERKSDRWHQRALKTPRSVRRALVYVLANFKKHGEAVHAPLDPCSSRAVLRRLCGMPGQGSARASTHAHSPGTTSRRSARFRTEILVAARGLATLGRNFVSRSPAGRWLSRQAHLTRAACHFAERPQLRRPFPRSSRHASRSTRHASRASELIAPRVARVAHRESAIDACAALMVGRGRLR